MEPCMCGDPACHRCFPGNSCEFEERVEELTVELMESMGEHLEAIDKALGGFPLSLEEELERAFEKRAREILNDGD